MFQYLRMKNCFFLLLLSISVAAGAQTKLIALKSHSGTASGTEWLTSEFDDITASDFGMYPEPTVKFAVLDSVIFVCDTLSIMVTSRRCTLRGAQEATSTVWWVGRANAIRHPLFSRQHQLDSIRRVLKKNYNFRNPIEKVVFVGFDNDSCAGGQQTDRVRGELPIAGKQIDGGPFDATGISILAGILCSSLLAGWCCWKYYRPTVRISYIG